MSADYRAEMGFSRRELARGLPSAVAPYDVEKCSEAVYRFRRDQRIATLTMGEERQRRIASIALPVIDVSISFENFSPAERDSFLDRFRKYTQRGGG